MKKDKRVYRLRYVPENVMTMDRMMPLIREVQREHPGARPDEFRSALRKKVGETGSGQLRKDFLRYSTFMRIAGDIHRLYGGKPKVEILNELEFSKMRYNVEKNPARRGEIGIEVIALQKLANPHRPPMTKEHVRRLKKDTPWEIGKNAADVRFVLKKRPVMRGR